MAWTFSFNVTNDTDRDLELVESQLHWGYWNTNGEEDKGPQSIKSRTNNTGRWGQICLWSEWLRIFLFMEG